MLVRCSLSNRILLPIILPANTDTVIFVYDMDKLSTSLDAKISDSETLSNKINLLKKCYKHIDMRFVPVA